MARKLYEFIADLKNQIDMPVLVSQLNSEYLSSSLDEGLEGFLDQICDNYLEALNIRELIGHVDEMKEGVYASSDLGFMNFELSEEIEPEEVKKQIQNIYSKVNVIQNNKELCLRAINFLNKAKNYLTSLKKAIESFIMSLETLRFKTMKDRERFINRWVSDIESFILILKTNISDLSTMVDKVLGAKYHMLMRGESSLRLLQKGKELEYRNDIKQAQNGKNFGLDDSGFGVEVIE